MEIRRPASIAFEPHFNYLGSSSFAPINRIRLTARSAITNAVLVVDTVDVDPSDTEWALSLDVPADAGSVVVLIELINVVGLTETIEWSGLTEPITVQSGQTTQSQPVNLFQGPPGNLGVTSVVITPNGGTVVEGELVQLTPTITSSTPGSVAVWSSLDTLVATVNSNGMVTTRRNGSARIIAVAGPRADTVVINATQRVASIVVTPDTQRVTSIGNEVTFVARVLDPRGAEIPGAGITWSVTNGTVAEHLGNGRFRARANGTTIITATSTSTPTVKRDGVFVVAQRAASMTIEPASAALTALGAQRQFSATVRDANGNVITTPVVWRTGSPAVFTVSATGLVTATGVGTAEVRAVANAGTPDSIFAGAIVTVSQGVSSVTVSPSAIAFNSVGDTLHLTAQARDANGNVVPNASFVWSTSNGAVATVDSTGVVRAAGNGNAVITASAGSASGTATVAVGQLITRITVSPVQDSVEVGDTTTFIATAYDANNNPVPGVAFTWTSSDTSVASVNGQGRATGRHSGITTIRAANGTLSGSAELRVFSRAPAFVVVLPDSVRFIALHDTAQASAQVFDNSENQLDQPVIWSSSNETIATVDSNGRIIAIGNGVAYVRALAGTARDSLLVVVQQEVASLDVAPDSVQALPGQVKSFGAAAFDANGYFMAAAVTWSSSDTAVASVDAAGQATARRPGRSAISATAANGVTAAGTIIVSAPNLMIARMTVFPPDTLVEGDSAQLTVVIKNNGNAPAAATTAQLTVLDASNLSVLRDTVLALPAVAAGDSLVFTHVFAIDEAIVWPDSITLRLTLDVANAVAESNEGDNVAMSNHYIRRAVPNLVASSLVTVPADTLSDGDTVQVGLVVKNTGTGAAGASSVRLSIMDAGSHTLVYDTIVDIPGIAAGDSLAIAKTLIIALPAPVDSITAVVSVDAMGAVAESNEDDNTIFSGARYISYGVAAIDATPASVDFHAIGDTARIHVTAFDRFGRPMLGQTPTYVVNQEHVATVDASGLLTAVDNGDTYVFVFLGTLQDTVLVEVQQAVATLEASPDSVTLSFGDSVQLSVSATDSNGVALDFVPQHWTSSDTTRVRVDSNTGEVFANRAEGSAWVHVMSGAATDSVYVTVVAPPPTTRVWQGASSNWHDPNNWLPAGAPLANDTVVINAGTPFQPTLTETVQIGSLVQFGATTIDVGAFTLYIGKSASNANITGTGTVIMTGEGGDLDGTLPNLRIESTVFALDPVRVTGNMHVTGSFDAGDTRTDVLGDFSTTGSGVLRMLSSGAVLDVGGDIQFGGGATQGMLTGGRIDARSDFSATVAGAFAATPFLRVNLYGSVQTTVSLAAPDTMPAANHFGGLYVMNPNDVVLASDLAVLGDMSLATDAVLSGPGRTATLLRGLGAEGNEWQVENTILGGESWSLPDTLTTHLTFAGEEWRLSSPLTLHGNAVVTRGDLNLGDERFEVFGNFSTVNGGTLSMTDEDDRLIVHGDVAFNGGSTAGKLSDGVLFVGGKFTAGTTPQSFAASADHVTDMHSFEEPALIGVRSTEGEPDIILSQPGLSAQRFATLRITRETLLGSDIAVSGDIVAEAGAALIGEGRTATVAGDIYDTCGCEGIQVKAPDAMRARARGMTRQALSASMSTFEPNYQVSRTVLVGEAQQIPFFMRTELVIASAVRLLGYFHQIEGDVRVTGAGADLRLVPDELNSPSLVISGDFTTENGGVLTMTTACDCYVSLIVFGTTRFDGGSEITGIDTETGNPIGRLTAGEIWAYGNFIATASDPYSFFSGGTSLVFAGQSAPQLIDLAFPATQRFHNVSLGEPVHLQFTNGAAFNGWVYNFADGPQAIFEAAAGGSGTLEFHGGGSLYNVMFDHLPVVNHGQSYLTLEDVTFGANYDPSKVQLTIIDSPEPNFWLDSPTFLTVPDGETGFYLKTIGDGFSVFVYNPNPVETNLFVSEGTSQIFWNYSGVDVRAPAGTGPSR